MNNKKLLTMALLIMGSANAMDDKKAYLAVRDDLNKVVIDQKPAYEKSQADTMKKIRQYDSDLAASAQRNETLRAQIQEHDSEIQQNKEAFEIEKQKIQEENQALQQRLGESQQEVEQLNQEVADADGNIRNDKAKNQKHLNKYRGYGDELLNMDPSSSDFVEQFKALQEKVKARKDRREKRQEDFNSIKSAAKAGKTFAEDPSKGIPMQLGIQAKFIKWEKDFDDRYQGGFNTSESEDEKGIKNYLKDLKAQKFLTPGGTQALQDQIRVWHARFKKDRMNKTLTPEAAREYHNLLEHAKNSEVYHQEEENKARGLNNSFGLLKTAIDNMEAGLRQLEAGEHGEASMQIEGADMFSGTDEMQLITNLQLQPQPDDTAGGGASQGKATFSEINQMQLQPDDTAGGGASQGNKQKDDMLSDNVHSSKRVQKNQDNKSSRSASTPKRITGNQNNMVD